VDWRYVSVNGRWYLKTQKRPLDDGLFSVVLASAPDPANARMTGNLFPTC